MLDVVIQMNMSLKKVRTVLLCFVQKTIFLAPYLLVGHTCLVGRTCLVGPSYPAVPSCPAGPPSPVVELHSEPHQPVVPQLNSKSWKRKIKI